MSWIRVDVSLPTHHKSLELAQILGLDRAHSLMVDLWCWAQVNAPDGRIGGRNPVRMVETAVGWKGEGGAFVDAALEARFIDRDGDVLVLHNWEEHNGKALKRAEESAGRMRAYRERKETERTRQRETPLAEADARAQTECEPNANGTHAVTQTECEPNGNLRFNERDRAGLEALKAIRWLVLDDLGLESDDAVGVLRDLIDHRYGHPVRTVITTMLAVQPGAGEGGRSRFEARYGPATVGRITHRGWLAPCGTQNLRTRHPTPEARP